MKVNPSLPKGMRDFGPEEVSQRKFITNKIKKVFEVYGYLPIETSSIENSSILLNKYGEEGSKLIFHILNSGDLTKNLDDQNFKEKTIPINKISNKALRYDLTVPLSRYIAQNKEKHPFPFRRYQIQNVWRADKPQKGRFREFMQCDIDIIGSNSIYCEAELISIIIDILQTLNITDYKIYLNNRNIIKSFANLIQKPDKEIQIASLIDKTDKIGTDNVLDLLKKIGLTNNDLNKLKNILEISGTNDEKISYLSKILQNDLGIKALESLQNLLNTLNQMNYLSNKIIINPNITRGLDYYTGTVFELKANKVKIGSIGGGGRYENMLSSFGLDDTPGVGFALGLDRIELVMKELGLLPSLNLESTKVLILNIFEDESEDESNRIFQLANFFRKNEVNTEVFPEIIPLKKQLAFADKRHIPFVVIYGENEKKSSMFVLRNMDNGKQFQISLSNMNEVLNYIS